MEHNQKTHDERRVHPAVKYVTWSAIVSAIPLILVIHQINLAYVDYHLDLISRWWTDHIPAYTREESDQRYARRTDFLTVVEADEIKKQVKETSDMAKDSAKKLDSVLITGAIQLVIAAEQNLQSIEDNPQPTREWRERRDEARERLTKAREYKDCLIAERDRCDALRVW